MIDRRIDLTENRDFSANSEVTLVEIAYYEDEAMSLDQYNTYLRLERIFGKRRHKNEKCDVFNIDYSNFLRRMGTCRICGKEFRTPWLNDMRLCKECRNYALPWKVPIMQQDDHGMNLFGLR